MHPLIALYDSMVKCLVHFGTFCHIRFQSVSVRTVAKNAFWPLGNETEHDSFQITQVLQILQIFKHFCLCCHLHVCMYTYLT